MTISFSKLAFVASGSEIARKSCEELSRLYRGVAPAEADVIVALGGDGFILETIHRFLDHRKPVFGLNRGSVGFLMNEYREAGLIERLAAAETAALYPLRVRAAGRAGGTATVLAFNEVSLLRRSRRMARIAVEIDGREYLDFAGDGIIVATPSGSTGHNYSAGGPIIPLGSQVIALTPISAFRPRRWRGALLRHDSVIRLRSLAPACEPVGLEADHFEVAGIESVEIREDRSIAAEIMFDRDHGL
ncbi:MAG TPA: NAD kinase, partial [Arenibaculum sp.]|nr:NAD kinase [Arenibaculum sp.]